jgi:hypothetical protein
MGFFNSNDPGTTLVLENLFSLDESIIISQFDGIVSGTDYGAIVKALPPEPVSAVESCLCDLWNSKILKEIRLRFGQIKLYISIMYFYLFRCIYLSSVISNDKSLTVLQIEICGSKLDAPDAIRIS